MRGQPFVISAPSGAGKSSVIKALRGRVDGLGYSVSHTTRQRRRGEKDGVDYHFIDSEGFNRMVKEGAFIEWAKVYTDFYGTAISSIDKQLAKGFDVLLDLDVQGAKGIREYYKNSVLIYLLPPSLRVLRKRLIERGTDDEAVIRKRMESAEREIESCILYDYIVINDELERAVDEAEAIIISERCRTDRRIHHVKTSFNISCP
jgi:guanylate kinase